jgi:hypothetical protein
VWWDGVNWIRLSQDRDQCRAVANAVMSLRFLENSGNYLVVHFSCKPLSVEYASLHKEYPVSANRLMGSNVITEFFPHSSAARGRSEMDPSGPPR